MSDGAPDQQSRVLWILKNAAGAELTCELYRTMHAVQLRFRSGAGLLYETPRLNPSDADSWARVWRAYYLMGGWPAPSPADAGCRPRLPHRAAPPVRTGPILRYWSRTDHEGAIVACELVRTETGLEVRCNGRPQRARLVRSMTEARELAEAWKSAVPV